MFIFEAGDDVVGDHKGESEVVWGSFLEGKEGGFGIDSQWNGKHQIRAALAQD